MKTYGVLKIVTPRAAPVCALLLAGIICNTRTPDTAVLQTTGSFTFARYDIDTNYGGNGRPGWVRSGDVDADGDIDIVAGGGEALFVYENDGVGNANGWRRFGSLDNTGKMGANGAVLLDVDGDADLDVVSAAFEGDIGWWENPGGLIRDTAWPFHVIATNSGGYLHDIVVADLDGDGEAREIVAVIHHGRYFKAVIELRWFRPPSTVGEPWESHTIEARRDEGAAHGHAGVDVGDIDRDGDMDISFSNGWYEASDDTALRWKWHEITDIYGVSNSLLNDIDADGDLDMVLSAGHHGQGAYWFENAASNTEPESWVRHDISSVVGNVTSRHRYSRRISEHLHHPECLALYDLDSDNDVDVVTCDLYFGEDDGEPGWADKVHNVYVYENLGGGFNWTKNVVSSSAYPSHLLQLVDLNEDGRMDIISEATGYSVVSYLENTSAAAGSLE